LREIIEYFGIVRAWRVAAWIPELTMANGCEELVERDAREVSGKGANVTR
jgi:hypothetical protein